MDRDERVLVTAKLTPDFSHRLVNNGEITANESLETVLLDSISLSAQRAKNILLTLNIYLEAETFYPCFMAIQNEIEDINCLIASYWDVVNNQAVCINKTTHQKDEHNP